MNSMPDYHATARPISAADAIAPAFRRARTILGVPFRLGFFLKICLFAALTESGFFSAVFSYPIQGASAASQAGVHHMHGAPADNFLASAIGPLGALGAGVLLLLFAAALVVLIVWAIFLYLFCRLRLTVLDLAIFREGGVRRAWRKYSRQAWRYFGLTILTMLVFLLIMAAVIGPFVPAFVRISRSMDPTHPDPFALIGLMLPLFVAIISLSLLGVVVDAIIRDFLLPPMIVEDASIESALGRFFRVLRHEPGQTSLYLFLRIVLSIVFSALLSIVFLIPVAIMALVAILIGIPLYHSLWRGRVADKSSSSSMSHSRHAASSSPTSSPSPSSSEPPPSSSSATPSSSMERATPNSTTSSILRSRPQSQPCRPPRPPTGRSAPPAIPPAPHRTAPLW